MPRMLIFLFKGGLRMKRFFDKILSDDFVWGEFMPSIATIMAILVAIFIIGSIVYGIMLLEKAIL